MLANFTARLPLPRGADPAEAARGPISISCAAATRPARCCWWTAAAPSSDRALASPSTRMTIRNGAKKRPRLGRARPSSKGGTAQGLSRVVTDASWSRSKAGNSTMVQALVGESASFAAGAFLTRHASVRLACSFWQLAHPARPPRRAEPRLSDLRPCMLSDGPVSCGLEARVRASDVFLQGRFGGTVSRSVKGLPTAEWSGWTQRRPMLNF